MKNTSLEDFIVLETERFTGDEKYFITRRSNFERMNLCSTFDSYGQPVDSYSCGCEDGEDYHTGVLAWNYWDGSNWRTIIIECDGYVDYTEVDEEISEKILSEMPEVPHVDGTHETIETESFEFTHTRWASDPWVFSVR